MYVAFFQPKLHKISDTYASDDQHFVMILFIYFFKSESREINGKSAKGEARDIEYLRSVNGKKRRPCSLYLAYMCNSFWRGKLK